MVSEKINSVTNNTNNSFEISELLLAIKLRTISRRRKVFVLPT